MEKFMRATLEKIEKHMAFLERKNVDRPLMGCIRGWDKISRYIQHPEMLLPKGEVTIQSLSCERFFPLYRNYINLVNKPNDLFLTLEPLPFFPWTEAAIGCPVKYTGMNFWSSPIEETKTQDGCERWLEAIQEVNLQAFEKKQLDTENTKMNVTHQNIPDKSKLWIEKYGEFFDFLANHFNEQYPVGQSVLRGPLDMAAAVCGDENMIYLFFEKPALMKELLSLSTAIYLSFVEMQTKQMRYFYGGYVIGQYYIWTPGTNLRHQEDAMALLSRDLYRDFIYPHDCTIASSMDHCLFHLHSTGLHLLDILLENDDIQIFQVTKDDGVDLQSMLSGLQKIQDAEKCLLLKGHLCREDIQVIKKHLNFNGLCVQAVVFNPKEEEDILSAFL